jgi:phage-related protein
MTLAAQDQTQLLAQFVEAYDGLVGSDVTLYVVNSGALSSPPEIEETFKVVGASVQTYVVTINLGVESATSARFPPFRQFKERCVWKYKGVRCKYAGVLETCDYTRSGANGCVAHDNEINFGGFPGINDLF